MGTYKIHITGIVQGVGFRPLVYSLAQKLKIKGTVSNTNQGVIIYCNTCETCVHTFLQVILENKPPQAHITSSAIIPQEISQIFTEFNIVESDPSLMGDLLMTPDYAVCKDCIDELTLKENHRFNYPFITCTNCGPRYSIIKNLPYDREFTAMNSFSMCKNCKTEYTNPTDRRFYSQTNSCHDCGISLKLSQTQTPHIPIHTNNEIEAVTKALSNGEIVAVKGIGGYLIMADATNTKTIQTLRERKHRAAKPFAVMVLNEKVLLQYCTPTVHELEEWNSTAAPIILFDTSKKNILPQKVIAPGLNQLGIMRAYTPLHYLICENFGKPLIATSANITNSPIIYTDEDANENLAPIADYILSNNRDIIVPQDDSVIRFTRNHQKIIYRRSRGFAPNFLNTVTFSTKSLAVGAMLKSAFAFTKNNHVFISQYLGATNAYDTQKEFIKVYQHLSSVLHFTPAQIISDKHPAYFSTEWAEQFAAKNKITHKTVQHHEAHFCAILGEHHLWNQKVLGFIWDGTGLGTDEQIWGGETIVYEKNSISRVAYLPYQAHILGDKMVNEPRISALSFFSGTPKSLNILRNKFSTIEWNAYLKLQKKSTLKTSSMGRLFDAVSSILNICNIASYHGEAAMLLEAQAALIPDYKNVKPYPVLMNQAHFEVSPILLAMMQDLELNVDISEISAKFHYTLVEIIALSAKNLQLSKLAFSGGVFQNSFLVAAIKDKLGDQYDLYFHKELSPNDECIAFGQLMHVQNIDKSH